MRRISMGMRDELLKAMAQRYRSSTRTDTGRILTEFAKISGYHRKHAERLLRCEDAAVRSRPRPDRRVDDIAVREALVLRWGNVCPLSKALVLNLLRTFATRFHTEYGL